jgi:hypothetical protein
VLHASADGDIVGVQTFSLFRFRRTTVFDCELPPFFLTHSSQAYDIPESSSLMAE